MRSLIILLFLSVARGVEIPLKNGIVNIDPINGHSIIVNLTKNGERNIQLIVIIQLMFFMLFC